MQGASRLDADKDRMRREMRGTLSAIPVSTAAAAGEAVARIALEESRVRGARRVALYAAIAGELPSRPLFVALRARGISCLFPRQLRCPFEFAQVDRWEELTPGRFGVPEPSEAAPAFRLESADVALVPGLAFDDLGNRLGRGGGDYDRALPASGPESPWVMGVAFAVQRVEAVPHDSRDRPVDAIVTERGLLRCVQRAGPPNATGDHR